MQVNERLRSILFAGLLILVMLLAGIGLTNSRTLERLDLVLYDMLLPFNSGEMSDQIIIIAIDDKSIKQVGRWPWSRHKHAELINRLTDMQAKSVGIDILFAEPQLDDPTADRAFAQALLRNARTVLSIAPSQPEQSSELISEILPLPSLAIKAAALAHVDTELDQDGLCRRAFLYSGVSDARWPALALAMLQQTEGDLKIKLDSRIDPNQFPQQRSEYWQRRESMLIPFAALDQKPEIISWSDLMAGRIAESAVRGKYVLVGTTAAGLGDALSTPASKAHQRMPGVVLHAHILNGLLQGKGIQPIAMNWQYTLTTLLIFITLILVIILPLRAGFFISILSLMSSLTVSLLLLLGWQLWFAPGIAVMLATLGWPSWCLWQLGVDARIRKRLLVQLEHRSMHHYATDLPNSTMLESRLNTMSAGPRGSSNKLSLMVIHFDWPGSASTTLGRPIADDMLKMISIRLQEVLPENSFIAHLNSDDFVVLDCTSTDQKQITHTARELLGKLKLPFESNDQHLTLSPKIGVSLWPQDGQNGHDLLRNAYIAMFKSRIDENEYLYIYSDDVGQQLQLRSQLERAIVHALERDEFELYYQPQIDAASSKIVGAEALIRWNSPQLGHIPPDQFIPIAEEVGLIKIIGRWVFMTACKQLRSWREEGLPEIRLSVNVSPLQFADPNLDDDISTTLKQFDICPASIELEITEGALMRNTEQAVNVMKRLKEQGIALAIDDFGTGYSSLSNLRHYPLDRLKIDKSFTQEVGKNHDTTEITLTILTMCKRLGLNVIAEGIETVEQADLLKGNECDEFQGFLFSRPVSAGQITQLLKKNSPLAGSNISSTS